MLVPGNPAPFWAGVLCALAVPPRTVKHTTTTQTLHVFSVYSLPAGAQSNDAARGHLISYPDTAMEASHHHPCLLAGDYYHDACHILAATCSSPLLALAKHWRLRPVNASIPNPHLTHLPHAAANAPSMIDDFVVSTSLFDCIGVAAGKLSVEALTATSNCSVHIPTPLLPARSVTRLCSSWVHPFPKQS